MSKDSDDDIKIVPISGPRRPPAAGKGRPKGAVNKTTASVKEMLLGALEELGGQQWLIEQAKTEPRAFMTLLARLIPAETAGSLEVSMMGPITEIRRTVVDPKQGEQE